MRRFSVRKLMVLIVGAAVGLAALRNASVFWASATATVVVVAVATSVVGALPLRSRERSAWAGFAVFSGVYLAVAVGTVVSNGFKDYFGPTVALEYVRSRFPRDQSDPALRERASLLREMAFLQQTTDQEDRRKFVMLKSKVAALDAELQNGQVSQDSADRWRLWLPGGANTNEFRCVGHSLFALLAGLLGTVVARIFYARRQRSPLKQRGSDAYSQIPSPAGASGSVSVAGARPGLQNR
jgi:hypothetical protein